MKLTTRVPDNQKPTLATEEQTNKTVDISPELPTAVDLSEVQKGLTRTSAVDDTVHNSPDNLNTMSTTPSEYQS